MWSYLNDIDVHSQYIDARDLSMYVMDLLIWLKMASALNDEWTHVAVAELGQHLKLAMWQIACITIISSAWVQSSCTIISQNMGMLSWQMLCFVKCNHLFFCKYKLRDHQSMLQICQRPFQSQAIASSMLQVCIFIHTTPHAQYTCLRSGLTL